MAAKGATSRPNLVWFMPDQQRADAVGCFGNPVAHTPNIDALAARGTRFDNAFVQHSVCGPSRVSQMTGWYPHTAGHRTLDNLLKPHEPNLLRSLKDAGYHVVSAGARGDVFAPGVTEASTDLCGYLVPPDPAATAALYTPKVPQDSALYRAFYFGSGGEATLLDPDEATVQTAIRWIEEDAPTDRPWFLWIPLLFPHPPFAVEEPWFSMHARHDMPAPISSAMTRAGAGKAGFMDAYRGIYGWDAVSDDDFREIQAVYYGMVSRTDDQLGRVVAAVEQASQGERTGWIYGTDHGEYLGDYGLVEKWPSGLDPQLTRNPLVVSIPGGREGQVCAGMVEMVDLLPTVLELVDTEAAHTHFGRSLVPLLHDAEASHRDAAFSEGGFRLGDEELLEAPGWIYEPKGRLQREQTELVGKATCLRTPEWTYVHRLYEQDELYDRVADPSETTNLIGGPEHVGVEAELRARLTDWYLDTSDVIPWESDPRFPEIPHGYR
ncbi:MAG: sulfatase-like hydrolase/transferase [Acidimicrobiales bacterium]